MKFLALVGFLVMVACGASSTGPLQGTTYCVDSVYYHLEQPNVAYSRDWVETIQNTFKLVLEGDTNGDFQTSGAVRGLVEEHTGLYVDTVMVEFLNSDGSGVWTAYGGRLTFNFNTGSEPFLADSEIYHSVPVNKAFTSVWKYSDVDDNEAELKVWWKGC